MNRFDFTKLNLRAIFHIMSNGKKLHFLVVYKIMDFFKSNSLSSFKLVAFYA